MLAEEGGFRYEVATEAFADAIVTVLSESFSREPMSAALGFSARDLEPIVTSFMPECTTNGLSVVAVPVDDPSTLAGVFICRDFKSPMPDSIPGDVRFSPVGKALMTVDEMYEAKRPGLKLGDAVDLWMVGVPAGQSIRKEGHREHPLSRQRRPRSQSRLQALRDGVHRALLADGCEEERVSGTRAPRLS